MKIVTVIGARPQFVKAASVSRELRKSHREILVHTGQHYDYEMSQVFFDELGIPAPDANLGVGSGPHGAQTAAMLEGIEKILLAERPDWVLIYGDTNSTLAGAIAAAKLFVRVAHVEAGLRSFNRRMPEELNRVVADHLSNLLLCPSETAVNNLAVEGVTRGVHLVGDVMSDTLQWIRDTMQRKPAPVVERLGLRNGSYLVCTVHRAENTDNLSHLAGIFEALGDLDESVVFPVHPRTRSAIESRGYALPPNLIRVEPLGYRDMVGLCASSRMILTDSGGLQKEAYWLRVPCITLRSETEWIETVETGWNVLAGIQRESIVRAVTGFAPPRSYPPLYGDGNVAARCVALLDA